MIGNIVIEEKVVNEVVECWTASRNALLIMGRLILKQIQMHDVKLKRNTRPEIIRYFMGILKVQYEAIDDYIRTAERWTDERLAEVGDDIPYTILRNTNPENADEMELFRKAIDNGWNATRFKKEKSSMMNDSGEYVNPLPRLQYLRQSVKEMIGIGMPKSVLERIEMVDEILEECENDLQNINKLGSKVLTF